MEEQTYAAVIYLEGPLARLVDGLRAELDPQYAGKAAHVTVLPPRALVISEEVAAEEARAQCAGWEPLALEFSAVGTFFPVNGVVYIEISRGGEELKRLHVALNQGLLARQEPFCYLPHITISQDMDEARTCEVLARVSKDWAAYTGPRGMLVETLVFVRQSPSGDWVDLAHLQLGPARVQA